MKFDLAPTLSASSSKPATRKRRTPPSLVAKLGIVRCHIHHGAHLLKKEFFETHMAPPPQTLPPKGLCKVANPQLKFEPKQQTFQKVQRAMVLQVLLDGSNDRN